MIHYCLSPLRTLTSPVPAGAVGPAPNAIGMIDFRSLPGHAGVDFAFMALDDSLGPLDADDRVIATAETPVHDLSVAVAAKDRTAWADALGVTLTGGISTLADLLAATFLAGDPTGETSVRPLQPTGRSFEIHLAGHSKVWTRSVRRGDKSDPFLAKALAARAHDIKLIADPTLRGKVLTDVLLRGGFAADRRTAKDVLGIDEEPRKRETTITDAFTRADSGSLGSSSEGWSWTELDGNYNISSNAATYSGAGDGRARAESALSSSDHYTQVEYVSGTPSLGGCGPAIRFSGSADTLYCVITRADTGNIYIYKMVAGGFTLLTSTTHTFSVPDTLKLDGSGSTLDYLVNGASKGTTTDSALTNLYTGMYGQVGNVTPIKMDDFIASDGVASVNRRRRALLCGRAA